MSADEFTNGCRYVSEDQVFSEPILKDFERDTGITVKSVFDTEESKSTGVTNRLIAEKDNPQADVYWANEPVRAEALKQRGVSTPYVSPSAEGIADQFKDPGSLLDRFFCARACAVGQREIDNQACGRDGLHGSFSERTCGNRESVVRDDHRLCCGSFYDLGRRAR